MATANLPKLRAAVIVPGFLNDAQDYMPLARALTARGIPSAVVPMPLLHWIPSIGGRSVRPVLERIDHAVLHVCAMGEAVEDCTDALHVPPVEYSLADGTADFRTNPGGPLRVGGSEFPDEYPTDMEPRGTFPAAPSKPKGSVALIGCAAGGYMARIYLSRRSYGGKAYGGKALARALARDTGHAPPGRQRPAVRERTLDQS